MSYQKNYSYWKTNPIKYWEKCAEYISWFKKWNTVLSKESPFKYKWFEGAELNTCYNCLDRHIEHGVKKKDSDCL